MELFLFIRTVLWISKIFVILIFICCSVFSLLWILKSSFVFLQATERASIGMQSLYKACTFVYLSILMRKGFFGFCFKLGKELNRCLSSRNDLIGTRTACGILSFRFSDVSKKMFHGVYALQTFRTNLPYKTIFSLLWFDDEIFWSFGLFHWFDHSYSTSFAI